MQPPCALLGFGHIAQSTHVPALGACHVPIVAILEPDETRRRVAQQLLPHAKIYTSYDRLLTEVCPPLVDICSPPHLHHAQITAALGAGAHVLCEKPLVSQLQQLDDLAALSVAVGRTVTCVHNWTAAPIIKHVTAIIAAGSLGPLRTIDAHTARTAPAAAAATSWRGDPQKAGGGIAFDHGWHGMSILLRWAQSPPLRIAGATSTLRHTTLRVEDTCQATLWFASGVIAHYSATWAAAARNNTFTLQFAAGTIRVVDDTLWVDRRGAAAGGPSRFEDNLALGGYRPQWTAEVVRQWLSEVHLTTRRGDGLDEARGCLSLLEGLYASSRAGGTPVALAGLSAAARAG